VLGLYIKSLCTLIPQYSLPPTFYCTFCMPRPVDENRPPRRLAVRARSRAQSALSLGPKKKPFVNFISSIVLADLALHP
jgi:hypothetical protein